MRSRRGGDALRPPAMGRAMHAARGIPVLVLPAFCVPAIGFAARRAANQRRPAAAAPARDLARVRRAGFVVGAVDGLPGVSGTREG